MIGIAALISAALGVAGPIVGSVLKGTKGKQLKEKISKMLKENSKLQTQLQMAYNSKNQQLLNSLIMSSPVGAAYNSIKNEIKQLDSEYAEKSSQLQDEANRLQSAQSDVDTAINDPKYVGVGGILPSINTMKSVEKQLTAAEQSQNGGMQNGL